MNSRFIPQYEPLILPEYAQAVKAQVDSGWIGSGKTVEDFEEVIKDHCKAKHVISTTSGTMAIFLGLSALDIPKHKKIAFPTYTFLAGANVIKTLGYEIEFVDIRASTMCMDPDKLVLDDNIGAVVFVNHNGYADYDMIQIRMMCLKAGIPFIQDSAQALGMQNLAGRGGSTKFGVYSFSVPKFITTGQGGVLFTDDDGIAERARQMRDHGDNWRSGKIHSHLGMNLKFNDMAAALGMAQLEKFHSLADLRHSVFSHYRRHLRLVDFDYPSTWMVIYRTTKADAIINALKAENIQAVKYYRPIPSNAPFLLDASKYTVAQMVYENFLYLPSSLNLTAKEINKICSIIRKVEDEEESVYNGD